MFQGEGHVTEQARHVRRDQAYLDLSDNTSFGDTETAEKPSQHENRGMSDAADADCLRSSQPKYENWSLKDLRQEIKRSKHASEEELNRIGFRYRRA